MKKTSLRKILLLILLLNLTNQQSQWNLLRITKGLFSDKKNEYVFQLYNPDELYEYTLSEEFLLSSGLPDYSKFNLVAESVIVYSSKLKKYHLKFQFMGSSTRTRFFENVLFERKLTSKIDPYHKNRRDISADFTNKFEPSMLEKVEDYFYFYQYGNTFNNNIQWKSLIKMYEENDCIKIDFLNLNKDRKQKDRVLDILYVKPRIQNNKFIFDLQAYFLKPELDKKRVLDLEEDREKNPVYLNFLIVSSTGKVNNRFKGKVENQEDMNNFENYLGALDGSNVLHLVKNKFNYISGYYMTTLALKSKVHISIFEFNTVVKNGEIEVKVFNENSLIQSPDTNTIGGFLTTKCGSDPNSNINNLLKNSRKTDFKLTLQSRSRTNKLTFAIDENEYKDIDTKNNSEFDFKDFMVMQIFPEDVVKCNLSVEVKKGENIKIIIDIIIKPNDQIQTQAKIKFNLENVEVNLADNFFKESSKNIPNKKCEIRNPNEYQDVGEKKISINKELQTRNTEFPNIFEIGLPNKGSEINRCFIYIENNKSSSNLEIMIEERDDIRYYPKLKLHSTAKKFTLFLTENKFVDCKFNEEMDAKKIIEQKSFLIETRIQHDGDKYEFKDFWKSSQEEEGIYYLNLGKENKFEKNPPFHYPFYAIGENKDCFVKITDLRQIKINIFSSSTVKLQFIPSDSDDKYDQAILLNEANEQIAKTTNLNFQKSNLTSDFYKRIFDFYHESDNIDNFDLYQKKYKKAQQLRKNDQEKLKNSSNQNLKDFKKSITDLEYYERSFDFLNYERAGKKNIWSFILFEADRDIFVMSMIKKSDEESPNENKKFIQILKNIYHFNKIFSSSENLLLSFENLPRRHTLKMTIWKNPVITEQNLNTGLYSINSLELNHESIFFMSSFKYEAFEKSLLCDTEIVKEYGGLSASISENNRFFYIKKKKEKNEIQNTIEIEYKEKENYKKNNLPPFLPLTINNSKPQFKIERNTIGEGTTDQFDFTNIFYTTPNERLLFICIHPDGSRLSLNLYDLNNKSDDQTAFYQNYSINLGIYSVKKSIFLENIDDSNIKLKIKFMDKRVFSPKYFIRDLEKVKCEYINLENVSSDKYFDPKISVKKKGNGKGIDVKITLEEKQKNILI